MRIKFVSKTPVERLQALWERHTPDWLAESRHSVTFDPDDRNYDGLVVYEDLPPMPGDKKVFRTETLACDPRQTLLITTEPASIRVEGLRYMGQYGFIKTMRPLTDDDRRFLQQAGAWAGRTPPLRPFYKADMDVSDPRYPRLGGLFDGKTKDLSTVVSTKAMAHTMHKARLDFVTALSDRLGDTLHWFGRGVRPIADKSEAMDNYRYHIAIENHIQAGHHTEKLTDCFRAGSLPFYFGDPDYWRVFPEDSVIPIDVFDLDLSEKIIRRAIANNEFEARQASLARAHEVTLKRYNPVAVGIQMLSSFTQDPNYQPKPPSGRIHGRHAFRRAHPAKAALDLLEARRIRRSPMADPLQGYKPLR